MRTVTPAPFTLYLIDELPTEAAKEAARDWWRTLEAQNPTWAGEHCDSRDAALDAIEDLDAFTAEDLPAQVRNILDASQNCAWTGYCADGVLWDNMKDWKPGDDIPTRSEVRGWYERAWEQEMESRMEADAVDENLRANEYEFTEDGRKA